MVQILQQGFLALGLEVGTFSDSLFRDPRNTSSDTEEFKKSYSVTSRKRKLG
jgi:hypothetical protein